MSDIETLEQLQHWIRSAGVSGMEGVEPPPQAEAEAAIRGVLAALAEAEKENERLEAVLLQIANGGYSGASFVAIQALKGKP